MATKKVNNEASFEEVDNEAVGSEIVQANVASGEAVLGTVGGEEAAYLTLPRLAIAYGVGNLFKAGFNPGDIVLCGEYFLAKKGDPVEIIILSANIYWKEYLSSDAFNAGIIPRIFKTEAEVLAAGGTTKWVDGIGPSFSRAMHVKLLVKKPKDIVCGMFGEMLDGNEWAPAVWDIDKTAYNKAAPPILTASRFSLAKVGLHGGRFELSTLITQPKNKDGHATVAPNVKLIGRNTPEMVKQIKELFFGPSDEDIPAAEIAAASEPNDQG